MEADVPGKLKIMWKRRRKPEKAGGGGGLATPVLDLLSLLSLGLLAGGNSISVAAALDPSPVVNVTDADAIAALLAATPGRTDLMAKREDARANLARRLGALGDDVQHATATPDVARKQAEKVESENDAIAEDLARHRQELESVRSDVKSELGPDPTKALATEHDVVDGLLHDRSKVAAEVDLLLSAAGEREARRDEIEDLIASARRVLEALRDAMRNSGGIESELAAKKEALAKQLEAYKSQEEELRQLEQDLAGRDAELAKLEQELAEKRRRLVELDAATATARDARKGLVTGAPVADLTKTPTSFFNILLKGGQVYPVEEPFFTRTKKPPTSELLELNPAQAGLSIDDALKPDSVVMRHFDDTQLKRSGQVRFLVFSDSFPMFRTLWSAARKHDLDCGWLPWRFTNIEYVAAGGAWAPSQR